MAAAQRVCPELAERLRKELDDRPADVAAIVRCLRSLGGESEWRCNAVAGLGVVVKGVDQPLAENLAEAVEQAGVGVMDALAASEPAVRAAAARAAGSFSGRAAEKLVPALSLASEDVDPAVRRAATGSLRSLGVHAPVAVARVLATILERPGAQGDSTGLALEALTACGPDAASVATPALARIVGDRRFRTEQRVAACQRLGWIGPDAGAASEALLGVVVGNEEVGIQSAAMRALISLGIPPDTLASRVPAGESRRVFLEVLLHLGPDGRDIRRALEKTWAEEPAADAAEELPDQLRERPAVSVDREDAANAGLQGELAEIKATLKRQALGADGGGRTCYSVEETAELTGYRAWTIRQACNKGRIKAHKGEDGRWRIPRETVAQLQEEGLPAG